MSKLELCCEICKVHQPPNPHLSLCCAKVICSDCFECSAHKCKKMHSFEFSPKKPNPLSQCHRCLERNPVFVCISCHRILLCQECWAIMHQSGKFYTHKQKLICGAEKDLLPTTTSNKFLGWLKGSRK